MENKLIKVYVKVNSSDEIIAIMSSLFLTNDEDWICVDEGVGDRFVHAQSRYLNKPIFNQNGKPNYKLINETIQDVMQ